MSYTVKNTTTVDTVEEEDDDQVEEDEEEKTETSEEEEEEQPKPKTRASKPKPPPSPAKAKSEPKKRALPDDEKPKKSASKEKSDEPSKKRVRKTEPASEKKKATKKSDVVIEAADIEYDHYTAHISVSLDMHIELTKLRKDIKLANMEKQVFGIIGKKLDEMVINYNGKEIDKTKNVGDLNNRTEVIYLEVKNK